jgi:hypothetical protein
LLVVQHESFTSQVKMSELLVQVKSRDENYEFEGEHNADGRPHGYAVAKGIAGSSTACCLREGTWVNGKMHGIGSLKFADGGRLEGEFRGDGRYGHLHGRGAFRSPDGDRIFDGTWANGFPVRGTALDADGTIFLAELDGRGPLHAEGWEPERWTPVGTLHGRPPPPPLHWRSSGREWGVEWAGAAALGLDQERWFEGLLRWLTPVVGVETAGGVLCAATYDGRGTLAEDPKVRP